MESLREFLESSTIHGLAHISSAPSNLSKAFWFLIVVTGFSFAFCLINSSYTDWQASPIATSITTHPISELDFPTITVCPPEGSNTVLNYDLARARNITLSVRDREALINMTKAILIDKESSDFVLLARSLVDEENILELFENKPGLTFPLPFPLPEVDPSDTTSGYAMKSSQLNGSFRTPGFGKKRFCNETFDKIFFALYLPLLLDEAEDANLEIKVHVEHNEGWSIHYREGGKYVIDPNHAKDWDSAKKHCKERNGVLANIENLLDFLELDSGKIRTSTWVGGTDYAVEDLWTWSDGTPLPTSPTCAEVREKNGNYSQTCLVNWAPKEPSGGRGTNCLAIQQTQLHAGTCQNEKTFVCRFNPSMLTEKGCLIYAI